MSSKLLQNGTVLSFDEGTESIKVLRNTSILIKDDEIAAIGENIEAPANAEVIDVSGKIISPGMINTHQHMWQTAYRTGGPNTTLAEYFVAQSQFSPAIKSFSSEDIYISSLEGYLEGLNGGVTGVVEHAHNCWSIGAFKSGWEAAVDSGARIWWCPNVEDREDCKIPEQLEFMKTLGDRKKDNHPLVSRGLAFDSLGGASDEDISEMRKWVKDMNIEAITCHHIGNSAWPVGDNSPVAAEKSNLQDLGIPIVFSHAGFLTDSDTKALREHDWNVSITPESEMHYGHGQDNSRFVHDQASLGLDTTWTFSGDVLTQARLWLQNVRGIAYTKTIKDGLIPKRTPMTVEDALLLATRQGGRAVRRDDVGVIKVGAKADILVFDGDSPNMIGWTDPIAAVVLHANVGDIESVIVGGEFRKRDGKLILTKGTWAEIAKKFAEVARRIQGENSLRAPPSDKFFGVGEWGDVEVMTTKSRV